MKRKSFTEIWYDLQVPTHLRKWRPNRNKIVDKDSARLGLVNEVAVGVAAANHRTICKFNDKDSTRYKPVWQTIQALCVKSEEVTGLSMSDQSDPSLGGPRYHLPEYSASVSFNANTGKAVTKEQTKSIFLVPFSRDPLFLGREDVIDLMDTIFESEPRVALTGIGGVGWVIDLMTSIKN